MRKMVVASCIMLVLCCFVAPADENEGRAVALVDSFIRCYQADGRDGAFAAAQDAKGRFVQGDLYLFVIDLSGVTYVHAGMPALVGKNNWDVKDTEGVYFFREFVRVGKDAGEGWVVYRWVNPVSKRIENKRTYIKRIPGTDFIVGCGYYSADA